eukprot:Phypoly_transcript_00940.p1 GENE.Phypoly_transcript_00940~~Phypoly_transcript_00940.p1  ORF type:complete len:1154 (+),score=157.66 Phypoly_transcript_00940:517-3462(+)
MTNIQTLAELYHRSESFAPLTSKEHEQIQNKIGPNLIDIPVPNAFVLLRREVLHPFFMFQIYSVIVWSTEQYYYYAAIIFVMAAVTAGLGFWEVRSNLINIQKLSHFECPVKVIRDGETKQVSSTDLVVGDVLEIAPFSIAPCDMAVVFGSCVVDESMLTGESTPVLKVVVPSQVNPLQIDPRHMVYGGTKISEVRVSKGSTALGVVVTSGYQTNKGLLVLSILFPKPAHFKFVQESLRFLIALFFIAAIGFGVVVWKLVQLGTDAGTIVQRACDLITVVVPPALPMAAGVGTAFAVGRLRKNKIFCVSLPRINMAGKINYMCFDKTGTLTEEGLDFMCVVPAFNKSFENEATEVQDGTPLKMGLIACHALTHIAGTISGDTLELKIFQSTHATLEEPHITPNFDNTYLSIVRTSKVSYGVLTQFEFMPKLQRMSVLVRDLHEPDNTFIITKGSPEMIFSLSVKETIPDKFWEVLRTYTHQGYRVLAMGFKPWNIPTGADKNAVRDEAEMDLNFLGFIVLQNKLKPETSPIIAELKSAYIRPVMITGDNVLTAVSIGKGCGLVDRDSNVFLVQEADGKEGQDALTIRHIDNEELAFDPSTLSLLDSSSPTPKFELAVTGKAFDILLADYKNKTEKYPFELIITAGTIWARMTPENKSSLVEELMNLGWYVGMCGDGANDCMALRCAHVGVSLSQAEASVSAPFTSHETNISCIPKLLREGRSALTTAFQLFRFMALYSIIQFANVVLLNFNATFLGNQQYLYQDLWVVFPLVILMGRAHAASTLSKKRPSGRLFSPHNMLTTVMHIVLTVVFQIILYVLTQKQSWFYNVANVNNDPYESNTTIFECTTIWIFAEFQYACVAILFTMERKFKQPIYTNYGFMSWWFITTLTAFLLLFVTQDIMFAFLQVLYIPYTWRVEIFWWTCINVACYIAVEVGFGIAKEKGLFSKGRKMKKHRALFYQYQAMWTPAKRVKHQKIDVPL